MQLGHCPRRIAEQGTIAVQKPVTKASHSLTVNTPLPTPSPPSLKQDDATRVLLQFRMVFGAVRSHFQKQEQAVGLGGAQVWALSVVAAQPGIGVGQLAQALNIRQPTASNMLKALLKRGLVVAHKADHDRRAVQISLTVEGQALLDKAPGPPAGVLPAALMALPPETLTRLEHDLQVLVGVLAADPKAAQTPLADL